jgi:hypothetical protein
MNRTGPWPHIVDCLRKSCASGSACIARSARKTAALARCRPAPNATTHAASIRHIEWQTMHTIRVSWSDATLGQCHDQTWRAGLARSEGVCVLTGVPVHRGDTVFRPFAIGRDSPVNAPHMILANTLRQDKPSVTRQNPGGGVCRIVMPENLSHGDGRSNSIAMTVSTVNQALNGTSPQPQAVSDHLSRPAPAPTTDHAQQQQDQECDTGTAGDRYEYRKEWVVFAGDLP